MNSVQTAVAQQIVDISPQVEAKVVDTLVTRELTRRSDALVQVFDKLSKEESQMKKIAKPDQATYDDKGAKVSEYFSKARVDEKAKLDKRIAKLTGALTKALEKGDFGDVYNLAGSGGDAKLDAADQPDQQDKEAGQ